MDIPKAASEAGFYNLTLANKHIHQYELLPLLHRDPFDRMLVAQALVEKVPLLTSDDFLKDYGVDIILAESKS